MQIGLFNDAESVVIPSTVDFVTTTGHGQLGRGAASYILDAAIDSSYRDAHPNSSFIAEDENEDPRGFRLAEPVPSTEMFGVIHDDATDNTARLKEIATWLRERGGGALMFSSGIARSNMTIVLPDNIRIFGEDGSSGLRNTNSGTIDSAPFTIGFWHPAHVGRAPSGTGGTVPWDRDIDMYLCGAAVAEDDVSVTLANSGDAALFEVGGVYYLRTQESLVQAGIAQDNEQPYEGSLLRVKSKTGGTIQFETPVGFDSATAPYLCIPDASRGDQDFGGVHFAQNIVIERLNLYGYTTFGNYACGAYDCHMRDIGGEVTSLLLAQGFVRCSFDGFTGQFTGRAVEIKFCAHDSYIAHIDGSSGDSTGPGTALIATGEHCRNVILSDFDIKAPKWAGAPLIALNPGRGCVIRNGRIFAPSCTHVAIEHSAGEAWPTENCRIENVDIYWAGASAIHPSAGTFLPLNNRVTGCRFYSTSTAATRLAVQLRYSLGMVVSGCEFPDGFRIRFVSDAVGNLVRNCVVGNDVVDGSGVAANAQRNNFTRGAPGTNLTPVPPTPRYLVNYNPPSLAAGASVQTTVTATGAEVGDVAKVSFGAPNAAVLVSGQVTTANTVTVTFTNVSGAAVDLGFETITVVTERLAP